MDTEAELHTYQQVVSTGCLNLRLRRTRHKLCFFVWQSPKVPLAGEKQEQSGQIVSRGVKRTSGGAHKPTLLWIEEDTLFLRELLQVWKPGVTVKQATSSPEALRLLGAGAPDLIVLDLAIPSHLAAIDEEEGFALLSTVRTRLRLDVPIVVVTRHTDPGHRDRALGMGADAYLTKPVKLDELERVIGELLVRSASDSPLDDTGKRGDRGSD